MGLWLLLVSGCLVGKGKYDALLGDLDRARAEATAAAASRDARILDLEQALGAEESRSRALEAEKNELLRQKSQLLADQSALAASVAEMERALAELSARKAAADARIAEFRNLMDRFRALIDAGKLRVKIVDGRMVVELATDILFGSGSASLSPEGKTALGEVATVLASIPDRSFQVEGHTDDVPIRTAQYRSNWDLAADRALTVVKALVDGGLPAPRVSAASYSQFRPARPNDTPEGKAANRRIEIAVVPDLSSLPGFDELSRLSGSEGG